MLGFLMFLSSIAHIAAVAIIIIKIMRPIIPNNGFSLIIYLAFFLRAPDLVSGSFLAPGILSFKGPSFFFLSFLDFDLREETLLEMSVFFF
ncbi:hypothetical protein GCM10025861_24170 [Methanobacterium petrolearium]|nr:hypothetical protein GCM10025861_24170 [Methanobacterium petrolearium]